jgi:hypothetical protein
MRRLSLFASSSLSKSDPFRINSNDMSSESCSGIGIYKGNVVFIKRVFKKSIDLTRNVRKELIQVFIKLENCHFLFFLMFIKFIGPRNETRKY